MHSLSPLPTFLCYLIFNNLFYLENYFKYFPNTIKFVEGYNFIIIAMQYTWFDRNLKWFNDKGVGRF